MNDYKVRALEFHSMYILEYETLVKTLDFMQETGLNTLILHRNDFIDLMVYPAKYFGGKKERYDSIFDRFSDIYRNVATYTQYRKNSTYQRRALFKRVFFEAKKRGIDIYIENKELLFPEILLEFHPELVKDGKICATEPLWLEFINEKYTEFFDEFPEVKGIITSISTRESRASIVSNRCTCERCKNTSREDWFRQVLDAMYEPIHKAGANFVVRDFVYHSSTHNELGNVLEKLPEDVIIALKNTPHDYYPTFPDNSRIGHVGNHSQWIEFDVWGQFYGFGVAPAVLIDDLRYRMDYALQRGAEGVMLRVDWEHLDSHHVFKNLNLINLIAGARISAEADYDRNDIYREYLEYQDFFEEGASNEIKYEGAKWFGAIMDATWDITRKAAFVDGHVMNNCSCFPISYDTAMWTAIELNSLRDWDPSRRDIFNPTEEHYNFVFEEKEEAGREFRALNAQFRQGGIGLNEECYDFVGWYFEAWKIYIEGCRRTTRAVYAVHYLLKAENKSNDFYSNVKASADGIMNELYELIDLLDKFYESTEYPNVVYTMVDPDRVRNLYKDLKEQLETL